MSGRAIWKRDPSLKVALPGTGLKSWESRLVAYLGAEVQESTHWITEWRIICLISITLIFGSSLIMINNVAISVPLMSAIVGLFWHKLVRDEAERIEYIREYIENTQRPDGGMSLKADEAYE